MLEEAAVHFEQVSELEDFASVADLMGVDIDDSLYAAAVEEVEIAVAEREGEP